MSLVRNVAYRIAATYICTNFIQKAGKHDAIEGRLKTHGDTDGNTMFPTTKNSGYYSRY